MTGRGRGWVALLAGALLLAGCGAGTADGDRTAGAAGARRELTVLAAASLTASFDQLKSQFEAANPGVSVRIGYDGSATLVQQISNGAPADVFASADEASMAKLVDEGLVRDQPQVFASNRLRIAVAPGNPKHLTSFADLARADVTVVVCAAPVPCGAATEKVERATGVTLRPASEETAVTGVLTKVTSGEADAGLVYVTDVTAAGDKVTGVDFPEAAGAVNRYPIAVLRDAPQADLATRFVEFVRGDAGRATLTGAGFGTP